MSFPSCTPPPVFSAFSRQRHLVVRDIGEPLVRDTFLDPQANLSPKKAMGWFFSGLALAFAGRWVWRSLFKEADRLADEAANLRFETNNILRRDPDKQDELNIAQSFSEALSSIYRLALADPDQRKALLAYLGSSVIGYISGSFAQATQETWVRREETKIRAHLINRLQDAFRQSIRVKNEMDNGLKEEARERIRTLLKAYGVPQADELLLEKPVAESPLVHQRYFYEPTHRTQFGAMPVMMHPQSAGIDYNNNPSRLERVQKLILLGLGAFTGFTLQGFFKFFTSAKAQSAVYQGKKVVYETIHVKDKEAWWINGIKNRRNFSILLGFFAMSAGARLGKLFIDGLREIEVTRVNARTELDYQTHNWLTQDPSFHRIAEQEALDNSLRQLEKELPALKANRPLLQQRVQAILANVGRNSAPKYFPMTPPVGLVVARS